MRTADDMKSALFNLWDNAELYTFFKGIDYVNKREIEITECMTNRNREMFLTLTKIDYLLR